MKKLLNKLNLEHFQENQTIILGFSGGPDSVFLLEVLKALNLNIKVVLAHVNHHLRGVESQREMEFVEGRARREKLELEILELPDLKSQSGNLEENARRARYSFFQKILKKYQADLIVTGHHLNDQTETILLNLSRGIINKGLQGIQEYDQKRKLYRPLLNLSKQEILEYLNSKKISYCSDSSNQTLEFARNRIRLKVIPEFEQINPNFLKTFQASLNSLKAHQQLTNTLLEKWLDENLIIKKQKYSFLLNDFLNQPLILQQLILQNLFEKLNKKSITKHQLNEILKTLAQNKSNRLKEFGKNYQLTIKKTLINKKANRLVVINQTVE